MVARLLVPHGYAALLGLQVSLRSWNVTKEDPQELPLCAMALLKGFATDGMFKK